MYKETPHAKQGDLGSKLPGEEANVEWTAGQEVTVAWTIQVILLLIWACRVLMVFASASEGYEALHLEARMVLYLSQISFSRQTMEVAISIGSVPRVSLLLRQFPPLINLSPSKTPPLPSMQWSL